MAEAWIAPGKLTAPTPAADWLERDLAPAKVPAVLLVAGPGYGKTVALTHMVQAAERAGTLTLWVALDAFDAEPATFFHTLCAGMQRHIPQFGLEVRAALQGGQSEADQLWRRFFQELAGFGAPVLMALDDAHALDEAPEILKGLAYWLDKLPSGVRVAIASRKRLPIPTSRLTLKRALAVLGPDDLRFSPFEVDALMHSRTGGAPAPEAWHQAAENLDGWPLGLDLVCTPGRAGAPSAARLSEYIAEEILAHQPDDRRRFMLQAALWPELSLDACRTAFGPEAAHHLAALEAEHLVQPLEGGSAYRFPSYLREFLLAEAERAVPAGERAHWHAAAAQHFLDAGQPERALPYLVAAEDWHRALDAAVACFPAMRHDGRQATIRRWLAAFPADVAARSPRHLLWHGHTLAREGRHAEAAVAYERSRKAFEAAGDEVGVFKVAVQQANMALLQEDTKRFGPLLMQALAWADRGLSEDQADLALVRALSAEQRGDMALMRECNEAVVALPIAGNVELAASHSIAAMNLYTFWLHQGDLARAHQAIDGVVAIAEAWGFVPYTLFAAFLKAHLYLVAGDVEAASALFKGVPASWPDLLDWHSLGCAYTVEGYLRVSQGDWKAADEALNRSLAIFEKAGFKEGTKLPLERLAWFAILRGHIERVDKLLTRAGLVSPPAADEPPTRNVYDLALRLAEARTLHLANDPAGALGLFSAIAPAAEEIGARLQLARVRLYEASARLAMGDRSGAQAALEASRALSSQHHFEFLFTQDHALWRELAPLAQPEATPAETVPTDPRGPAPLALYAFGGLEVRLGGVLVDRWPRRKAKLILAALVLHPKGLRQGELAEVLGPGGEEATASTVKVAVLSLRRSLEPELVKGEESAYVRMVGDRYQLDGSRVAYLDVTAFTEAADAGDALRRSDPVAALEAYTRAMALYRDNLLDETLFEGYFEAERERLRARALEMLAWMAEWQADRGDVAAAETAWKRSVAIGPCEEAPALGLMRHYQSTGRPERVKQVYWDFCRAAKTQLGMGPSDTFTRAYQAIGAAT